MKGQSAHLFKAGRAASSSVSLLGYDKQPENRIIGGEGVQITLHMDTTADVNVQVF